MAGNLKAPDVDTSACEVVVMWMFLKLDMKKACADEPAGLAGGTRKEAAMGTLVYGKGLAVRPRSGLGPLPLW
jgi:hypothetical protein